jgi:hypothetical protein
MTWIYSLFFLNSDYGVAAGYQEDWSYWRYLNLNITTDSGTNWQWTNGIPWYMGRLYSVHFVNDSIGFTAGRMSDSSMYYDAACVFKSIDGGRHWQLKLFDLKLCWDSFNDVHFVNADTGWVISMTGCILRTDNGGDRWYFQDSGVNKPLNDLFFLDDSTGWIAGDDGIILKTTSGGITAIDSELRSRETIPESVRLYQNYPNPFNPRTVISWELAENSEVTLEVYNLQGQKNTTLLSAFLHSGYHSVTFNAAELPSGIYFYQLKVGKNILRRKMVLVK